MAKDNKNSASTKGAELNEEQKAAQLAAEAKAKAEAEAKAKEEATENIAVFEYGDKQYKFSDRCPKKLQIDGQVYTQDEILNDEDLIEFLVVGNSPFVTLHF